MISKYDVVSWDIVYIFIYVLWIPERDEESNCLGKNDNSL